MENCFEELLQNDEKYNSAINRARELVLQSIVIVGNKGTEHYYCFLCSVVYIWWFVLFFSFLDIGSFIFFVSYFFYLLSKLVNVFDRILFFITTMHILNRLV